MSREGQVFDLVGIWRRLKEMIRVGGGQIGEGWILKGLVFGSVRNYRGRKQERNFGSVFR